MNGRSGAELVDSVITKHREVLPPEGTRLGARLLTHSLIAPTVVEGPHDHVLFYHVGGANNVTRYAGRRVMGSSSAHRSTSLVPAGEPSGWLMPDPVEVLHVSLGDARLRALAEMQLDIDPARVAIREAWSEPDPFMTMLCDRIMTEMSAPDPLSPLMIDQFEGVLAAHLLRHYSNVGAIRLGDDAIRIAGPNDIRIRRVREYIEASLDRAMGMDELARVACLSVFHFSRAFRQATGTTPHAFVTARRVARAKALLATDMPLPQVAGICGFADAARFARTFHRATGATPEGWRRSLDD